MNDDAAVRQRGRRPAVTVDRSSDPASVRVMELFAGVRLTPVQRRIARHIADQMSEAAFLSSVELAERVGVSQPSVTRFAATLGFTGYGEFQRAIREIIVPDSVPDPERLGQNKVQHAVQRSIETLGVLQEFFEDTEPVVRAARLLSASSPLLVYGSRSSAALAQHFVFFASRIWPNVRLITGGGSSVHENLMDAQLAGASSLLAIVLPRYPSEALGVLEHAERAGVKIVLVTDTMLSPLARFAEVVLPAPVNTELVFDAPVAALQALVVLLEALADVDPARTRQRLEELETLATDQHFFLEG